MNPDLLNTLVEKNIVAPGTEIEAKYLAPGLDGSHREEVQDFFTIVQIALQEKKVAYLKCTRVSDGASLRAVPGCIIRIDGMEPADLGKAFDILPDGKMKKVKLDEFGNPVRRGRKPKHLRQGTLNEQDNRSKKLGSDKAKKSAKTAGTGNSEAKKAVGGRKQPGGETSKRQRNAKAVAN